MSVLYLCLYVCACGFKSYTKIESFIQYPSKAFSLNEISIHATHGEKTANKIIIILLCETKYSGYKI